METFLYVIFGVIGCVGSLAGMVIGFIAMDNFANDPNFDNRIKSTIHLATSLVIAGVGLAVSIASVILTMYCIYVILDVNT